MLGFKPRTASCIEANGPQEKRLQTEVLSNESCGSMAPVKTRRFVSKRNSLKSFIFLIRADRPMNVEDPRLTKTKLRFFSKLCYTEIMLVWVRQGSSRMKADMSLVK